MNVPINLHVNVTKECIESGTPADSRSCPIALAVYEQYPAFEKVSVTSCRIDFELESQCYSYKLPDVAEVFIEGFDDPDDETPLVPFEFDATLDIEDIEEKLI